MPFLLLMTLQIYHVTHWKRLNPEVGKHCIHNSYYQLYFGQIGVSFSLQCCSTSLKTGMLLPLPLLLKKSASGSHIVNLRKIIIYNHGKIIFAMCVNKFAIKLHQRALRDHDVPTVCF